jgi:large subunit ribosomal protein L16
MLMPKRTKYRKQQRGKNRGKATRGNKISFGEYGIQSLAGCHLNSRQLEAARKAIARHITKGGKIWIRVFPDHVITARPADTRMGKGKGQPVHWVAVIKPGTMLFEVAGITKELATQAMISAGHKLPCRTRMVTSESLK